MLKQRSDKPRELDSANRHKPTHIPSVVEVTDPAAFPTLAVQHGDYVPTCSCGWHGAGRVTELAAQRASDIHTAARNAMERPDPAAHYQDLLDEATGQGRR